MTDYKTKTLELTITWRLLNVFPGLHIVHVDSQ